MFAVELYDGTAATGQYVQVYDYGGGRGIRTPERVTPLTVFKTAGFNHSPIPPPPGYRFRWPPRKSTALLSLVLAFHRSRSGDRRRLRQSRRRQGGEPLEVG